MPIEDNMTDKQWLMLAEAIKEAAEHPYCDEGETILGFLLCHCDTVKDSSQDIIAIAEKLESVLDAQGKDSE